jgi:hypothetical protein
MRISKETMGWRKEGWGEMQEVEMEQVLRVGLVEEAPLAQATGLT